MPKCPSCLCRIGAAKIDIQLITPNSFHRKRVEMELPETNTYSGHCFAFPAPGFLQMSYSPLQYPSNFTQHSFYSGSSWHQTGTSFIASEHSPAPSCQTEHVLLTAMDGWCSFLLIRIQGSEQLSLLNFTIPLTKVFLILSATVVWKH
jgi:hypothetical protein